MHNATLAASRQRFSADNPLPRFANDWISAWLQFDQDTNLLHIGAGPHEWLFEPVESAKLASVLSEGEQLRGEFNPGLKIALIPGAHQIAGTSFFRLHV
ncbi:hypothetical protein [Glutamicibacter sp.]|uniref:hypothetical protein n=1 Tax=Glutamicibacter sp. TaxID=1931995 RepID=UPI0028BE201A|nr:hypothetical protein [Glutamicibacter sp.]